MFIVKLLFKLVLLLVFTFGFLVLFQYGPSNFVDGAEKEAAWLQGLLPKETSPDKVDETLESPPSSQP